MGDGGKGRALDEAIRVVISGCEIGPRTTDEEHRGSPR